MCVYGGGGGGLKVKDEKVRSMEAHDVLSYRPH